MTEQQAIPVCGPVEEEAPGRLDAASFEILRELGKGGMATILLAREKSESRRLVALKVIHPHLADDPDLVARFHHEVRAQTGLRHPNVVEMLGWGRDGSGRLFMAMEYVDGPTLKEAASRRRMPVELAMHVAQGVLQGLAAAHERGLVHRDVKPANVMITRDGQVKVADFGIAKAVDMTKLTSTGNVVGTPAYMSPEQALAKSLDARSDLFSVGVMLYEMVLGENPFLTGNPATTLSRVVHHQQRPAFELLPQTPVLLEALIDSLLTKDPDKRPKTAEDALARLAKCVQEDGAAVPPLALARFLTEPDTVTRELASARALRHFERGRELYAGGQGNVEGALWEIFLATLLDPGNATAHAWLDQVSGQRGYSLQRRTNPRIDELEARLAQDPENVGLVVQLAKAHKAQGNYLQVIFYYKRAKALRPDDRYTMNQLTTLVGPQAAPVIDGTGMFASPLQIPVPAARPRPVAVEAPRADGWLDFIGGIVSTPWAKVGAVAGALVCLVLAGGAFIDHAVDAAQHAGHPKHDSTSSGDPAADRASSEIARAQQMESAGKGADAEAVLRKALAEQKGKPFESELAYMLGDCLEKQGHRQDALAVHQDNATRFGDTWAARSLGQRGEILAAEHDLDGARKEYQGMADMTAGDLHWEALADMADVTRQQGAYSDAVAQYESLLPHVPENPLHDRLRLSLAGAREDAGDREIAKTLYGEIRDSTDHRSPTFKQADAGYQRMTSEIAQISGKHDDTEASNAGSAGSSTDDTQSAVARSKRLISGAEGPDGTP